MTPRRDGGARNEMTPRRPRPTIGDATRPMERGMEETEPLAEMALESAFDGAATLAHMYADLVAKLVERGSLSRSDARELLLRAAGFIRYSPAHSMQRDVLRLAEQRLAERLGWPPGSIALSVDPLPPGPEQLSSSPKTSGA